MKKTKTALLLPCAQLWLAEEVFATLAIVAIRPLASHESRQYTPYVKVLIPPGKEQLFQFYRMALLPDGFPGASPAGNPLAAVEPHPLYGVYVIRMSLDAYEKTGDPAYLEQAVRVGHGAVSRMQRKDDALIFLYPRDSAFNRLNRDFYSALTQAKYVSAFWKLFTHTKDSAFNTAAEGALASLAIPLHDGGVMHRQREGVAFEEAPNVIPLFILNGWLSVLENIYAYSLKSKSKRAAKMFSESVTLLQTMIPLYDLPEYRNSRYALAGTVPFQLTLPHSFHLETAHLLTANQQRVPFSTIPQPGRWSVALSGSRHKIAGNLVYSVAESGQNTYLELKVVAESSGSLVFASPRISYDIIRGAAYSKSYSYTINTPLDRGRHLVRLSLASNDFHLSCYPTNFKKNIGGKHYNSYHYMHIKSLRKLHAITNIPVFSEFADKWTNYTKEWTQMALYKRKNVALHSYDRETL